MSAAYRETDLRAEVETLKTRLDALEAKPKAPRREDGSIDVSYEAYERDSAIEEAADGLCCDVWNRNDFWPAPVDAAPTLPPLAYDDLPDTEPAAGAP